MPRMLPARFVRWSALLATIVLLAGTAPRFAFATIVASDEPQPSLGAEAAAVAELRAPDQSSGVKNPGLDLLLGGPNWNAIKFLDVAILTGFYNIPPDPMGAAGPDRNINTVNTAIESWTKTGALQWRVSLKTFVSSLAGTLLSDGFDAKVVYDHHAGRFVVCLLERSATASRILVAVSKTNSPASGGAADWYYYAINSLVVVGTSTTWADYPGLEVDEDAIYITTNQFRFSNSSFAGTRLWIVNKTPLYTGGVGVHTVWDYAALSAGIATTTMPALVFGAGGAGPGIGTYLVSYSGLNNGIQEFLQVTRVDNPVGVPTFTQELIPLGPIDNLIALPGGPQLGSAIRVDAGDRRVFDAVWRNNNLWLTASTLPVAGPNMGETTTHWWRISTAGVTSSASPAGLLVLADNGEAGANDVAAGAYTAWSGIAVNSLDEMKLSYAVFAPSIYPSAGIAGRQPADPPGTLQPSIIARPGLDFYVRTFTAGSTGRNRWGDYTGMCIDPSDDRTLWTFNQYADVRGNPTTVSGTTEDGQWATFWGSCSFACATLQCPPQTTVTRGHGANFQFCITNCSSLDDVFTYQIINQLGWCLPASGSITIPPGGTVCVNDSCFVPDDAPCGMVKPLIFHVTSKSGQSYSCEGAIMVDCTVPTRITMADAESQDGGVMLHWTMADGLQYQGFDVYREEGNTGRVRLTDHMLTGGNEFSYFDAYVSSAPVNYWLAEIDLDGSTVWHGPIAVTNGGKLPTEIAFSQARPNPFDASTTLGYALPRQSSVRMTVFDAAGHLVRTLVDGIQPAGSHSATWNGTDLSGRRAPVGIYMVVLNIGGDVHRQKVMLGR